MNENSNFKENNGTVPQNPYYQNQNTNPYYQVPAQQPVMFNPAPQTSTADYNPLQTAYFKKTLRRAGNSIGLQLISFFVISVIVSMVGGFFAGIIGIFMKANFLSDSNFMLALSSIASVAGMVFPCFITQGFTKIKIRDVVPIAPPKVLKSVAVVMLSLGIAALSNLATSIFSVIYYSVFGQQTVSNDISYGNGLFSLVISVITVGVIPALVEEFAFRGVILGTLRKYVSDGMAIFISTLFFSLIHGNLVQIPFTFGLGLGLAYATVYTKSIWPAVIVHFLNNTMSVVLSFATMSMNPVAAAVITYLYLALLLLIGICGLILLIAADRGAFKLSKNNSYRSLDKAKWFFTSPGVIVFIAICLLEVALIQLIEFLTPYINQLTQYAG